MAWLPRRSSWGRFIWPFRRAFVIGLLLAKSVAVSSAGRFISMGDNFLLRNWDMDDGLPSFRGWMIKIPLGYRIEGWRRYEGSTYHSHRKCRGTGNKWLRSFSSHLGRGRSKGPGHSLGRLAFVATLELKLTFIRTEP